MPTRARPLHLETCARASYGYFGNLEIFSLAAFETLVANVDSCKASLPWQIGVKNGIYGPMGEDLFAQQRVESQGVSRVEARDTSADGACETDRPEGEMGWTEMGRRPCLWVRSS